jgi:hypothetical protein
VTRVCKNGSCKYWNEVKSMAGNIDGDSSQIPCVPHGRKLYNTRGMLVFVHGQSKAVKSYPISSTVVVHVCIPINGVDPSGRAV